MKTTVVCARQSGVRGYVLIGRGSAFGNPYCIGPDADRAQVLAAFERYFLAKVERDYVFRARVLSIRGRALGCPGACPEGQCHGDIIARWVDAQPPSWRVAFVPEPEPMVLGAAGTALVRAGGMPRAWAAVLISPSGAVRHVTHRDPSPVVVHRWLCQDIFDELTSPLQESERKAVHPFLRAAEVDASRLRAGQNVDAIAGEDRTLVEHCLRLWREADDPLPVAGVDARFAPPADAPCSWLVFLRSLRARWEAFTSLRLAPAPADRDGVAT